MTGRVRSGRALAGACLGLAVVAALLWGASVATWYRAGPTGVAGGTVHPWLAGVALLALAGVAAVVATAGIVRRALGGMLGIAGAWAGVVAAIPAPGETAAVAPLLAVGGGVILVAVGVFVLVREPRLARVRLGGAAREPRREHADPDRAAWAALDEGRDPTIDSPGPDGGRGGGAV